MSITDRFQNIGHLFCCYLCIQTGGIDSHLTQNGFQRIDFGFRWVFMNTINKRQAFIHRHRSRRLIGYQHKFFDKFLRFTAGSRKNVFHATIFNEEFAFTGFNIHGTALKSAFMQQSGKFSHFLDFREKLVIFCQNLIIRAAIQNRIDLAVHAFHAGTNIALGKAVTDQIALLIESQQSRESQAHFIRIQGADTVGQFFRKHWQHLIRIVDRGTASIGLVIQCRTRLHIVADVCDMHTQFPYIAYFIQRNGVIDVLRICAVDGENIVAGQVQTIHQLAGLNAFLSHFFRLSLSWGIKVQTRLVGCQHRLTAVCRRISTTEGAYYFGTMREVSLAAFTHSCQNLVSHFCVATVTFPNFDRHFHILVRHNEEATLFAVQHTWEVLMTFFHNLGNSTLCFSLAVFRQAHHDDITRHRTQHFSSRQENIILTGSFLIQWSRKTKALLYGDDFCFHSLHIFRQTHGVSFLNDNTFRFVLRDQLVKLFALSRLHFCQNSQLFQTHRSLAVTAQHLHNALIQRHWTAFAAAASRILRLLHIFIIISHTQSLSSGHTIRSYLFIMTDSPKNHKRDFVKTI